MSTKPIDIAASITDAVEGVTKAWAKKRKAEERSAGARARRYDHMVRQDRFTILEAAWVAMKDAYMKASDNGRLPTRPRQIMYAARPEILELTEKDTLDDRYFTQTLLSDYVAMNPEECHDWDIVWDARGHFTEPHTGHEIALGTLEVREYLGLRAKVTDVVTVDPSMLFPTHGPKHRFNFGTLGTSNRRYSFVNDVPVVDIGLRLQDVEEMGLESEPTDVSGNWWKREETLRRHGATAEEIPLETERVELNVAMTSRQLLDFVEAKLEEHGVEKLVPEDTILEQHARRLIKQKLASKAIARVSSKIAKGTASRKLPADLTARIAAALGEEPHLPWDAALATVLDEG